MTAYAVVQAIVIAAMVAWAVVFAARRLLRSWALVSVLRGGLPSMPRTRSSARTDSLRATSVCCSRRATRSAARLASWRACCSWAWYWLSWLRTLGVLGTLAALERDAAEQPAPAD